MRCGQILHNAGRESNLKTNNSLPNQLTHHIQTRLVIRNNNRRLAVIIAEILPPRTRNPQPDYIRNPHDIDREEANNPVRKRPLIPHSRLPRPNPPKIPHIPPSRQLKRDRNQRHEQHQQIIQQHPRIILHRRLPFTQNPDKRDENG